MDVKFRLNDQSPAIILFFSFVLIIGIGIVDILTGPELSLVLLYILPVLLVTWFVDFRAAMVTAVVVLCSWMLIETRFEIQHRDLFSFLLNHIVRFCSFYLLIQFTLTLKHGLLRSQQKDQLDPVSRVLTRHHFFDRVSEELIKAHGGRYTITVFYVILDLSPFLETYLGNIARDSWVYTIATVLRGNVLTSDCIGRLCEDRFAGFMPATNHRLSQAMLSGIEKRLLLKMGNRAMHIRIVAATFEQAPSSSDVLFEKMDHLVSISEPNGTGGLYHVDVT